MPIAIAIMGPTAAGKSDVAEDLAKRLGVAIVNADAFQVYRGLDIGTNKPKDRSNYKLIDILEPNEPFSVGRFVEMATPLCREDVVVCGGTGLYVRALFEGYSEMTPSDPHNRQQLKQEVDELGAEAFAAKHGVDNVPNRQHLLRSVEKGRLAKASPSTSLRGEGDALASQTHQPNPENRKPKAENRRKAPLTESRPQGGKFGIQISKPELDARIEKRVQAMVQNGWQAEVERLLAGGADPSWPAFRAIGYQEMAEVVAGRMQLDAAIERINARTRQYAKRQMTWLRKEPNLEWLDGGDPAELASGILKRLGEEQR